MIIKTIVYIILSLCVFCFGTRNVPIRIYILENGTEHKIELNFFHGGGLKDSIVLFRKGDIYARSSSVFTSRPVDAFGYPDSVSITFDNSRKAKLIRYYQKYKLEGIDKDFLYYKQPYKAINKENYKFTFTEEDFENAIAF